MRQQGGRDDSDKKDQFFTLKDGMIRIESKASEIYADTSSEVMLQWALTRRSLAMDQANLMDYNVMQVWTEKIVRTRVESPPQGFEKPSMKQLLAADVKFFEELADRARSGIQANVQGRPLDDVAKECMYVQEVAILLQPRPMSRSDVSRFDGSNAKGKGKSSFSHERKGKGFGKSKGKVKGSNFSKLGVGRAQPGASPYVSITTWEVVVRKLRRADAERDITFAVRPDAVSTMQRSTVISCRNLGPEVFLLTMSQHSE